MKIFSLIAMLTIAVILPGGHATDAASTPQPHAVFASTTKDFGTVKTGQAVKFEFQVRNAGTAPLIIKKALHKLPQIKIHFGPDIPPGETANITVEIDTTQLAGEISDKIILLLNDPDQTNVVLTIMGVVVLPIDILPRPVAFFSVFQGDTAERTLTVINNQEHPLFISRLEPRGTHFNAVIEPIEAGRRYRLRIAVPNDTTPGRYRESVTLHTNDPKFARLHVAVNILVKRDVYVSRENLDFGHVNLAHLRANPSILPLMTNTFLVKRRDNEMTITSVTTDVPFLDIQQDPPERSQIFRFDVGLDMERIVPGTFDGTIVIKTDDPEFPELIVPVRGVIE